MPHYTYRALSEKGVIIEGESVANSAKDLSDELIAQGLLVQKIRVKRSINLSLNFRKKIKPETFLLFNQELITLIKAGLSIVEALDISANRPDQPTLEKILKSVKEDVTNGLFLSEACAKHPDIFDTLYISTLKIGEKTGALLKVLQKYQVYLKRRVSLQKKVSQSLTYPIFLLITMLVILGVLFVFVLPRFVNMYASFDADLPGPTQMLLAIIESSDVFGPVVLILCIFIYFAYRHVSTLPKGRMYIDKIKLRIPLVGKMVRTHAVAQFSNTLATLLDGGTPLVDAMHSTANSMTNSYYKDVLHITRNEIVGGKGLAVSLQGNDFLPNSVIKIIEVGEASGSLSEVLNQLSESFEELLEYQLARITSLVEPLLMLTMGIFVGGIIIVMYLPIFSIADIIK